MCGSHVQWQHTFLSGSPPGERTLDASFLSFRCLFIAKRRVVSRCTVSSQCCAPLTTRQKPARWPAARVRRQPSLTLVFTLPLILSERAQGAARPGRTSISLIRVLICHTATPVQCRGTQRRCWEPFIIYDVCAQAGVMDVPRPGYDVRVWRATYLVCPGVSCWPLLTVRVNGSLPA